MHWVSRRKNSLQVLCALVSAVSFVLHSERHHLGFSAPVVIDTNCSTHHVIYTPPQVIYREEEKVGICLNNVTRSANSDSVIVTMLTEGVERYSLGSLKLISSIQLTPTVTSDFLLLELVVELLIMMTKMPIISQIQTTNNSFFGKKRRCIKAARRAAEEKDAAQGDSDRGAGARDLRAEGPRGFGGAWRNLRHLAQGGPGHLEREVGVPLPCLCVWPSAEGGGSQDVERRQCVCAAEEGPRRPEEGQRRSRRSFEEEPREERRRPREEQQQSFEEGRQQSFEE